MTAIAIPSSSPMQTPQRVSEERPAWVPPENVADPKRRYGLLQLEVQGTFAPKNARSTPPSLSDGMSSEVGRMLAIGFNKSDHAKQRNQWMLLMANGGVVILSGITGDLRPSDPTAFPPFVTAGLTKFEAEAAVEAANAERFKHARVPREWTVSVAQLFEREGGAE